MRYVLDEQLVRSIAAKRGYYSLGDIASELRVHRNTLRAYLSGHKGVLPEVVQRLTAALKVEPFSIVKKKELDAEGDREYRTIAATAGRLAAKHRGLAFCLIGSRAGNIARKYSDWDVAVTGGAHGLDSELYLELRAHFEDACDDFARSVDLVNMDAAPAWFCAGIKAAPIYMAGSLETYNHLLGVLNGVARKNQS